MEKTSSRYPEDGIKENITRGISLFITIWWPLSKELGIMMLWRIFGTTAREWSSPYWGMRECQRWGGQSGGGVWASCRPQGKQSGQSGNAKSLRTDRKALVNSLNFYRPCYYCNDVSFEGCCLAGRWDIHLRKTISRHASDPIKVIEAYCKQSTRTLELRVHAW